MAKLIKKEEPNILYASDGSHKKSKEIKYDEVVESELELHLKREKQKRGGKFVIIISNLPENPDYSKKLAKELKKYCACGGTVKKGNIEVQGDKFDQVNEFLLNRNIKTKKIGG
tara:strand:- start:163657 stop:163998 length:342 start_codon:yes stop_codon:yes gene_type:complete